MFLHIHTHVKNAQKGRSENFSSSRSPKNGLCEKKSVRKWRVKSGGWAADGVDEFGFDIVSCMLHLIRCLVYVAAFLVRGTERPEQSHPQPSILLHI